ncbi:MAG TPA: Holliday junction branch migration protein RuvA [Pyrinomonadaceae bacterium]|nr:Holliday junction branch migration protein RuvA [Pyrinomonadaceae bacterium]
MIAHLSGTLLAKQATSVILDVGGVGYEVTIPVSIFYDMEELGAQISLRIYTHVREEALQLFGFKTARERELFQMLISVSGIGPKSAIAMLSGMNADEIIGAIRSNNLARLTSIPGLGKKTAERLVIELRDKMTTLSHPALEEQLAARDGGGGVAPSEDTLREDTLSALTNLGYKRDAAEKVVNQAMHEGGDLSVELLLRRSLKSLSKG